MDSPSRQNNPINIHRKKNPVVLKGESTLKSSTSRASRTKMNVSEISKITIGPSSDATPKKNKSRFKKIFALPKKSPISEEVQSEDDSGNPNDQNARRSVDSDMSVK